MCIARVGRNQLVGCRFVQMALQVVAEQRKGTASPYAPYIRELPADFTTPLMWTDAELAELQYPYILQEVRMSSRGGFCFSPCSFRFPPPPPLHTPSPAIACLPRLDAVENQSSLVPN